MRKISINELTQRWGEKMNSLIARQRELQTVDKEIQGNAYYRTLLPEIAMALCEEKGLDTKDYFIFGPYCFGIYFCDVVIGHEDPLWLRVMLHKTYVEAKGKRVDELVYETGESNVGHGLYYVDNWDRKRELKPVPDSIEGFLQLMMPLYADETMAKMWEFSPPTAQEIRDAMS